MNIVTTLDQNARLFELLTAPDCALKAAITGDVYEEKRFVVQGINNLEDVVINSLPITGDQIQLSVANVNIYVADLNINGTWFANTKRLNDLLKLALIVLYEGYGEGWQFNFSRQDTFDEPESQSNYVNIRIDFRYYP